MATTHNIAVIVGSLRKESYTLKVAKALVKLAPDTLKLNLITLHDISFFDKPVGIVSNSPGVLGGVNAAMNLKQLLPGIVGPIMGQPEIYLTSVGDAFDEHGELIK